MVNATLSIRFAGPLVTFQDGGRFGHLRFGVPASGPMDRFAHAAVNTALGNAPDATAIEISMGGLMLECTEGRVTVAIAGGCFAVEHAGNKRASWTVLTLNQGEKLNIRPGDWGSWAYLAVAGQLDAPSWLGHTATHSLSGFGGGAVVTGASIHVTDAEVREAREGDLPIPEFCRPSGHAHVVMGPQDHRFEEGATEAFLNNDYVLTDAYDRMGVRLDGPSLPLGASLSIPSEPVVRGSLQVSGDGIPTLLLADHGTTGGYPKIAAVISSDLNQVTQMRARESIRFAAIEASKAVSLTRAYAEMVQSYLSSIATSRGSLAQRLMSENLISGVIFDT